ncbi:MAG: phosphoribosylamine--glycine ligase [Firmicutes bacterium]|nr:phosphoribosylamine--glycine ligase [Bacillota bacterium]
MKVLVIGSGGREHALAWKLAQSPMVTKLFCCPGNGGTAQIAENVALEHTGNEALADFAESQGIDLTVVGPETYLADGLVDCFKLRGLPVFGPSRAAARLESSKAFAKDFMAKYQIPTASFKVFTDPREAKAYLGQIGAPVVVKADGLAAGKGVVVAFDPDTAMQAVDQIMTGGLFGASGARVIIEEYLEGEEVSLLVFCDGKTGVPMLPVQDHKRIGAGDTGPNTGGMGTYAPTTVFTDTVAAQVANRILKPTLEAMQAEGAPFCGVLFLGLMITKDGPKVVEYNVRFGDPETQVVLPLLEADLAQIFMKSIGGGLSPDLVKWRPNTTAVCVVAASGGYPGEYPTGRVITGLDQAKDSLIFHAGTKVSATGDLVTSGGRVINVVHLGRDIEEAVKGAYRDIQLIHFDGIYYRPDIGSRELERRKNLRLS